MSRRSTDWRPGCAGPTSGQQRESPDLPNGEGTAGFRFKKLLACHDPRAPAEATLVLAAVAALNGFKADGSRMPGRTPDNGAYDAGRAASLRKLADESGLSIGAVRRGVTYLKQVGAVEHRKDGIHVVPVALRARWNDDRTVGTGTSPAHRFRVCLTREARALGMRAEPLLLTGLIEGQSINGKLMISRQWLAERTGWVVKSGKSAGKPARRLDDIIRSAEAAGAIHSWVVPQTWQMWFAVGRSRNKDEEAALPTKRPEGSKARRDPATIALAFPQQPHRVPATPPLGFLQQHQDSQLDVHLDSPRSARSNPEGETTRCVQASGEPASPARARDNPEVAPTSMPSPSTTIATEWTAKKSVGAVEQWVLEMAAKNVELLSERNVVEVAVLLDHFGPPAEAIDLAALRKNRLDLARRVIKWCPSPSMLGGWLCCVLRDYGVSNLGGYLRRTVEAGGDPGTLLGSHMRNRFGRGAETLQHFTTATEKALEGKHAIDVQKLVAGTAQILASDDGDIRRSLQEELRRYLAAGRRTAARCVVLKLVDNSRGSPSDEAIAAAVGDACSVAQARELMAA